MAYDAISDAQIQRDAPLDTTLLTELKNRDDWLKSDVGNADRSDDLLDEFQTGHDHSGGDEGPLIDSDGIASDEGGIWKTAYILDGTIVAGDIAAGTFSSGDLANGAVDYTKVNDDWSTAASGGGWVPADPVQYIAHGLSRRPVVCERSGEFNVMNTDSTNVAVLHPPARVTLNSGNWGAAFRVI